jgi:hypothetical protein
MKRAHEQYPPSKPNVGRLRPSAASTRPSIDSHQNRLLAHTNVRTYDQNFDWGLTPSNIVRRQLAKQVPDSTDVVEFDKAPVYARQGLGYQAQLLSPGRLQVILMQSF